MFYLLYSMLLIIIIYLIVTLKLKNTKNKIEKILDFKLTDSKLSMINPEKFKIKIKKFDNLLFKQIKKLSKKYKLVVRVEKPEEKLIYELLEKSEILKYIYRIDLVEVV